MSNNTLITYTETVLLPALSPIYAKLGLEEQRVMSMRKLLFTVKQAPPAFIVAEFVYAWANNYSSCHIGNLDTLLLALPTYAPDTQVIVLTQAAELPFAEKLRHSYPFFALFTLPVHEMDIEQLLKDSLKKVPL